MKSAIAFIVFSLLLTMVMPSIVNAYSGGYLNGVSGTKTATATPGDTVGTVVTQLTDNNETTGSGSQNVWFNFTLPSVSSVTQYRYKASGTNNNTVKLYDASLNLLGTETLVANGTLQNFSQAYNGVKYVSWNQANGIAQIYEADVFGAPDVTPPAVPTGLSGTAQVNAVALTWNANATDTVGYNLYMDGTKVNGSLLTGTSYTKTGLTAGTAYTFELSAVDGSANESAKSSSITKTPLAAPDTTPPDAPTNLTGTGGNSTASLTWIASSAGDVAGYHVFQNGGLISGSLITGTSYVVTGLVNGTSYDFTVKAFDNSGNGSVSSNAVTITPADDMAVTLNPNGTSIIVHVAGGTQPYNVTAMTDGTTIEQDYSVQDFAVTGLAKDTDYTITITDANGLTYTEVVNTGSITSYVPPVMPDSTSLFQKMLNSFGDAGTIALSVIGGAVALGILIILGLWGWRLTKKWLATSK